MQLYEDNVQDLYGNARPGVSVLVEYEGSPATIYSDNGVTPKANPLTTGAGGSFSFYAANGVYTLTAGEISETVTLFDSTELATAGGAALIGNTPAGSIAAETVQDAINELDTEKTAAADLAVSGGAALVGYDGGTAQDVLDDAKPMQSYTALRAYTGRATGVRITSAGVAGFFARSATDVTSADNGGTIIVDGSGRRWLRLYSGAVNVIWFGAAGDGVTDDTAALQAWANYLRDSRSPGFLPAGQFLFTQLVLPFNCDIQGAGLGNYGGSPSKDKSVLLAESGTDDDAIIFETETSGGFERVNNMRLQGFLLVKQGSTDTVGHGIAFRKAGTRTDDANHAIVCGNTALRDLIIRGFPENGIYLRRGCVPMAIENVYTLFNGKYGFECQGLNLVRGLWVRNLTGDGNKGGAVARIASASSNSLAVLDGVFTEFRDDNPYGNTGAFPGASPYAVELGDFGQNGIVNLSNIYANSTIAGPTAADAAIYLNHSSNTTMPMVSFDAVSSNTTGSAGGNGSTLYDALNSVRVPSTVKKGTYSRSNNTMAVAGTGLTIFGDDGEREPVGTGAEGMMVKGATPVVAHHETDASADAKTWTTVASSGELTDRTVTDAGVATIYRKVQRSGGSASLVEYMTAMKFTSTNLSMTGIPTYADNAAALAGGLGAGRIYKTAAGEMRVVV
jgi:hypothetical protein